MKNLITIILFTFFAFVLNAQELIIEYDYIGKTSVYKKVNKHGDTVIVKSPVIKAGQDVMVEVINFNDNALYAEAEITNETLIESSNPFGMLGMLSPIFNVASKGVLTNMFDERGVDISDVDFGYSSATENDGQLSTVKEQFETLSMKAYNLAQLEQEIVEIEYGLNQLYKLSRNTNLYPSDIKEQARQIVSRTLSNGDVPELSNFYRKRESILKTSREQIASVKLLSKNILKYENQERFANEENLGFSNKASVEVYDQLVTETEVLLMAIDDFQNAYSKDEVEQMLQLMQQIYFSINNSNFTHKTTALAEGDRTNINLTFYQIPPPGTIVADDNNEENESEEDDDEYDFGYTINNASTYNPQPQRTKSFGVNVSGGLKISPSIGISFPSYVDASKDYFARGDTTIVETSGSNYLPNITAFVNFYPYTGRAVNIGGTFGVGIPITGDNISPNFMLGPALVLGNKYRIIVTAGMSTGPVKRLENGFEVGQTLNEFQEIKTKNKYAIGFYSAISFTLGIGG